MMTSPRRTPPAARPDRPSVPRATTRAAPRATGTTAPQVVARIEVGDGPSHHVVILQSADGGYMIRWTDESPVPGAPAPASARPASTVPSSEAPGHAPPDAGRLADAIRGALLGEPVSFDAWATPDGPPFFRACWDAARRIPRGETRTYAQLARMAGRPGAARAAGAAMRANPMPIVVPCHRVVARTGLGGFAGSSDQDSVAVRRKAQLLAMECVRPGTAARPGARMTAGALP